MPNHSPIKELISKSKKVAIFWHTGIDGDALWSTVAFGLVLTKLGLKVDYYTPKAPSKKFDFLPDSKKFSTEFSYSPSYDLIICMDCGGIDRLEDIWTDNPAYFESRPVLNIDHHITNPNFGSHNYVDTTASSACEYLAEILLELYPDEISANVATYLFLWLSTDTGHFIYEKDSERTFGIAMKLMQLWARKKFLIDNFYRKASIAGIKFMWLLSQRIEQSWDVIYTYYTDIELEQVGLDKEEADSILGIMTRADHDGVFVLFKWYSIDQPWCIKASLRTKNPAIHVNEIASRHFNGWGHYAAAWCKVMLDEMSFEEKMAEMIEYIQDELSNQN